MRMNASDERRRLGLGKVSRDVLERSVYRHLPMAGAPRLDGGVVRCQGEVVVAHSPSIGVPLESLGFFAFHYGASNVAALSARPKHLVAGIYLPVGSEERDLEIVARVLGGEARRYGVTVVAGQTATYAGIEAPFVTATCLGEKVGTPVDPAPGDVVYVIGEVGGEAMWLKELSMGVAGDEWRRFTPLPVMLRLHGIDGVALMHDVSEGGVKRALLEVSESLGVRLDVATYDVRLAEGVLSLREDPLRLPTYGVMIALARSDAREAVEGACAELDVPCSRVGVVEAGEELIVDGKAVEHLERVDLDRLYGSFREL
jgi:hydrogenase maturation factor